MIKRLLRKIALKIYVIGKSEFDRINASKSEQQEPKCIIGTNTIINPKKGWIQNSREIDKITIGSRTIIDGHLMTYRHGGEIKIGDSCFVGENSKIWSSKKITIGDRVLISHNVNIHDNNSHPLNSAERHIDYEHIRSTGTYREINMLNESEIIIEDDVWIGFNSTIMRGVKIGKGAIVGACTFINKDVPPFAVVVGNPARIIKYTD